MSIDNCRDQAHGGRVDRAFLDQEERSRKSILNVARMGRFSSDRTVREYAEEIWGIEVGGEI